MTDSLKLKSEFLLSGSVDDSENTIAKCQQTYSPPSCKMIYESSYLHSYRCAGRVLLSPETVNLVRSLGLRRRGRWAGRKTCPLTRVVFVVQSSGGGDIIEVAICTAKTDLLNQLRKI